MVNWKEIYSGRLSDADSAVKQIGNGQRVVIAGGNGRPEELIRALIRNASSFKDVRIMHGLSNGGEDYCRPEYRENFIHESLFASKGTRKYIEDGSAQLVPIYYHEIPLFFENGTIPMDVFMCQATPPNEYGYCSVGVVADFIHEAVEAADLVLVQINREMPFCGASDCLINVKDIDCFVEFDEPLAESPDPEPDEIEREIGRYCATLINDRDTIQAGIGRIPNAVCEALSDKKDLGVHSELLSDGLMKLWKKGVITNKYKAFDKGQMVATFAMGTKAFYDFIDNNPAVKLKGVRKTNDPLEIAKCTDLKCIMTCIEVDLQGQIVSSTSGLRQISGAGGQLEFMRGAGLTYDHKGRSIMCMTSTHVRGGVRMSRIKSFIEEGSAVTVGRQDADYFVTEYGIACLRGKNMKERARELIGIAHPDYREELIETFERRFKTKY